MRTSLLLLVAFSLTACRTPTKEETGETLCTWYRDADGDGFGNAAESNRGFCDATNPSYVRDDTDCDDMDAGRNPRALEICDGVDNDCDEDVDEDMNNAPAWYLDQDGDGYGDPASEVRACVSPEGYGANGTDCDDQDANSFPGATERCDGLDNDCDDAVDEDLTWTWYADTDGDSYGNPEVLMESCDPGPGWVQDAMDCDDTSASVNPDREEVCDGLDQDCDGEVDEGLLQTWYRDADGDAWGLASESQEHCAPGEGWVLDPGDCDDLEGAVNPDATEGCNGRDDDCDGLVDDADTEDVEGLGSWYADADADGWGTGEPTQSCEAPEGTVALDGDCDDGDPRFHPGADESDCTDPSDYNCDGATGWADNDGDGFAACEECDDRDDGNHPGATESCDGEDNDCDGTVDEADAVDADTFYADLDGDGHGDPLTSTRACEASDGWVALATDCDDGAAAVHPTAAEVCNGADDDCDGAVDEAVLSVFYQDGDGDGFGDAAEPAEACSAPSGWVSDATDCDDGSATIYPGATEVCDDQDDDCDGNVDEIDAADAPSWYKDRDEDGYGDATTVTVACDPPSGYVGATELYDCDDRDNEVYPFAPEACDGEDQDCDGAVDDDAEGSTTYYGDADGDGFGDPSTGVASCSPISGYVTDATDCDDGSWGVHPGAAEVCDGTDQDCDGVADDSATDAATWYQDKDGDTYGDAHSPLTSCDAPPGWVTNTLDCDDGDLTTSPDAAEVCDGVDNDCDGTTDEAAAVDALTFYRDGDRDGFGDPSSTTSACAAPSGYVAEPTDGVFDCDDGTASSSPAAAEVCDGADNDCDGEVDEGSAAAATWYRDADGDGYGDGSDTATGCAAPSGYVASSTDCDDSLSSIHPGAAETCDGTDQDCDGTADDAATDASTWYRDGDGDGWGGTSTTRACGAPTGYVSAGGDCDDASTATGPGAIEACNGVDDDCDGSTDESDAADAPTWYRDRDEDGWGDAATPTQACTAPSGYVTGASGFDCDDRDAGAGPGAAESCNGKDDDCDGSTDESDATDADTWYTDADGDGWGDAGAVVLACTRPSGAVADSTDCDDTRATVYPGAAEVCDGLDQDCDGSVDDSATDRPTWYADGDGDGYGTTTSSTRACEAPAGWVALSTDCDDARSDVNPAASEVCNGLDDDCDGSTDEADAADAIAWYRDRDEDGWGDATASTLACTAPSGYVAAGAGFDCNDRDATTGPGASETCNGKDDDCDGSTDESDATDATSWYADADADGYGAAGSTTRACSRPTGYVSDATDCDDTSSSVKPGAVELCDGQDNDCDGALDTDAVDTSTWYRDGDGDGYGSTTTTRACAAPTGYTATSGDCDDTTAASRPGASEVCDDADNDCDGSVDESATDLSTWYIDGDGDGYGSTAYTRAACDAPTGYVATATDCNDASAAAWPGATEVCDGVDNDCDGSVDEGVKLYWYLDYDGDGYGLDGTAVAACSAPTSRYTDADGDCDDTDLAFYPGASLGCDGQDYDCDGSVDNDADGDGYADVTCGGDDCDDGDPATLPEIGGGCAMGTTCWDILDRGRSVGDGEYTIDPDGYGTGVDPVEVYCDMTTDGGGWTMVEYAADLPFKQQFTGGDSWRWLGTDFTLVLSKATIQAIQALSTEGTQTYVGLCEHVIHYYYTAGKNYDYAFGFEFLDGSTTPYGKSSYSPYAISLTQDSCAGNGGEGGALSKSSIFVVESVKVPITNVISRDAGDTFPEYFGSPLTDYPAWLR